MSSRPPPRRELKDLQPVVRQLPPTQLREGEKQRVPSEQPVTTVSDINPAGRKEEPTTWYTEKDRMSIVHVQVPRDSTTEYFHRDEQINQKILAGILIALILALAGAFF